MARWLTQAHKDDSTLEVHVDGHRRLSVEYYGKLSRLVRSKFSTLRKEGMALAFIYNSSCSASNCFHIVIAKCLVSIFVAWTSCQSSVFHWPFMLSSHRQDFYATKWAGLAFLKSRLAFPQTLARRRCGFGALRLVQHSTISFLPASSALLGPAWPGRGRGGLGRTKAGAKGTSRRPRHLAADA